MGGMSLVGVDAADTPPAAVGDLADLFHVDVEHVVRPPGLDDAGFAGRLAIDVEVVESMHSQLVQPPGHGRDRDRDVLAANSRTMRRADHLCFHLAARA